MGASPSIGRQVAATSTHVNNCRVPFVASVEQALDELRNAGLLRAHRVVSSSQGTELVVDGKPVVCFCSNNYLGLAEDARLIATLTSAVNEFGLGAGASRLISGSMGPHHRAEEALAEFMGLPDAALFTSGYAANVGSVQALVSEGDVVFSDALNHASIIDGCRLSRAKVHVYKHRDVGHLRQLLEAHRESAARALIVSDSLFSMEGVRAPVLALRALADQFRAGLLVDEAHALGVLGPHGAGVCAEAGVVPEVVIGTLGKAFGIAGAFAAGSHEVVSWIRNRARSYVYSTAPPPALSAATITATQIVRDADEARTHLSAHAKRLRGELSALGYTVPEGDSQIIPVHIGDNHETMQTCAKLLELGVFVQGIRPPTVPVGTGRLRLTPMATHTDAQIKLAIEAFAAVAAARGPR